jgi:hypothetical protein
MSLMSMIGLFILGHRTTLLRLALLACAAVQTCAASVVHLLHDRDIHAAPALFLVTTVTPSTLCVWWVGKFAPMRPSLSPRLLHDVLDAPDLRE